MLDETTRLLAQVETPGVFATRRTAPAGDLRLEVKGVGPLRLPISAAKARELCEEPRHGRAP